MRLQIALSSISCGHTTFRLFVWVFAWKIRRKFPQKKRKFKDRKSCTGRSVIIFQTTSATWNAVASQVARKKLSLKWLPTVLRIRSLFTLAIFAAICAAIFAYVTAIWYLNFYVINCFLFVKNDTVQCQFQWSICGFIGLFSRKKVNFVHWFPQKIAAKRITIQDYSN